MNAKVSDALTIARSILSDDGATKWSDPILFSKVSQAHTELITSLVLNGLSIEIQTTTRLLLSANTTSLGVLEPTNIVRIIKMWDITPGNSISNAVPMSQVEVLPNLDREVTLRYWCYNEETITFLGATVDREVIINYFREPSTPTQVESRLDVKLSEIFLGPRIAALAVISSNPALYQSANQMAEENLSKIVRIQVKGEQNLPVRRRPFGSSRRSRFF